MLQPSNSAFGPRRRASLAGQFATLLDGFYRDLLEQGIPENLAALVRRLDRPDRPVEEGRKVALVVETDEDDRSRAAVLLEESGLAVIECASATAAVGILHHRAADTAFVFADQHLDGDRDGVELARSIATWWPDIRVVVTMDRPISMGELPPGVVALAKPWRALDVLIEAERVVRAERSQTG